MMSGEVRNWSAARSALGGIALLLATVVVAALCIQTLRQAGSQAGGHPVRVVPQADETPSTPTALFIGDSYTAGDINIKASYAEITAAAMHWVYLEDAQAGTGFVADGQAMSAMSGPYYSRLESDRVRFRPDYVIVTGGRDDAATPVASLTQAARQYLVSVHKAFPQARMIIVAPFWVDGRPSSTLLALRDAERNLAPSLGAVFVDPLAEKWITFGNRLRYIDVDQVELTLDGHQYLAQRLTADLGRADLGREVISRRP